MTIIAVCVILFLLSIVLIFFNWFKSFQEKKLASLHSDREESNEMRRDSNDNIIDHVDETVSNDKSKDEPDNRSDSDPYIVNISGLSTINFLPTRPEAIEWDIDADPKPTIDDDSHSVLDDSNSSDSYSSDSYSSDSYSSDSYSSDSYSDNGF